MTKTLTTRKTIPLLLSLVSAILLFLLLAPTASAKTYTISGTGTKTKAITVPKGYYQMTLSWSNNGKERICFDIGDTKKKSTYYGEMDFTVKSGKSSIGFYAFKKQKYKFSVESAKKGKWKITLKPVKATTKLTLSGKGNKVAYIKVPKGTYKLNYTYSNNKPTGKKTTSESVFVAYFTEEVLYANVLHYLNYPDDIDPGEEKKLSDDFLEATDSDVIDSDASGKSSSTIVVKKDSYYLLDIQADITNYETGTLKPNHNVKWSFKLTPVKDK